MKKDLNSIEKIHTSHILLSKCYTFGCNNEPQHCYFNANSISVKLYCSKCVLKRPIIFDADSGWVKVDDTEFERIKKHTGDYILAKEIIEL